MSKRIARVEVRVIEEDTETGKTSLRSDLNIERADGHEIDVTASASRPTEVESDADGNAVALKIEGPFYFNLSVKRNGPSETLPL